MSFPLLSSDSRLASPRFTKPTNTSLRHSSQRSPNNGCFQMISAKLYVSQTQQSTFVSTQHGIVSNVDPTTCKSLTAKVGTYLGRYACRVSERCLRARRNPIQVDI